MEYTSIICVISRPETATPAHRHAPDPDRSFVGRAQRRNHNRPLPIASRCSAGNAKNSL
jgi:hypothetical protein